jgi:hypothetical protein
VDVLIATDGGFRADAERATAVDVELTALTERLTRALPGRAPTRTAEASFAPGVLMGSVLASIPGAAETLAKVFAHQYTVSGTELAAVHGAVDLRVAGALRARLPHPTALTVRVERLWTPTESPLRRRIAALLEQYAALQEALAKAESAATHAASELSGAEAARTAAQTQLVELSKGLPTDADVVTGSAWSTAWAYATERASADLTTAATTAAETAARVAALRALNTAVGEFLAALVTPTSATDSGLLASAMRGEWLHAADPASGRVILYVNTLHGGVDQVITTKFWRDHRTVLAGSAVEYALVGADGSLLTGGVRDNRWGGVMSLSKPQDFRGTRIDSRVHPAVTRREPAAGD